MSGLQVRDAVAGGHATEGEGVGVEEAGGGPHVGPDWIRPDDGDARTLAPVPHRRFLSSSAIFVHIRPRVDDVAVPPAPRLELLVARAGGPHRPVPQPVTDKLLAGNVS